MVCTDWLLLVAISLLPLVLIRISGQFPVIVRFHASRFCRTQMKRPIRICSIVSGCAIGVKIASIEDFNKHHTQGLACTARGSAAATLIQAEIERSVTRWDWVCRDSFEGC
eukprot:2816891-Rhodomonas_salina.1